MKSNLLVLAAVLVTAFTTMPVSAQVSNGSFETGVDPGGYTTLYAGDSTSIPGWTVDVGSVDYVGGYWQAAAGSRSIDMNGFYQRGQISQTIATVPGTSYLVTFDMSGNPDGGPGIKSMSVSATGAATQSYQYLVGPWSPSGNTHANMQWAAQTYAFVATGSSTTLSFASDMPDPATYGPVLDNVSVTAMSGNTICHRDNGKPGGKTLTVNVSAIPAHLAHGDTLGPCAQ